jgi:transcription initiation factor TFIIIB Brf1 subunit/transcription initiation factor TFIIB
MMTYDNSSIEDIIDCVYNEYPHSVRSDEVLAIYRQFLESGSLIHKMHPKVLLSAILLHLLRQRKESRTIFEMSQIMNIDPNELAKAYRHFLRISNMKSIYPTVDEFLERYCNKLNISGDVQKKICNMKEKLCNNIDDLGSPQKAASAIIYLSCEDMISRKEILNKTFVTQPTMKRYINAYKDKI